MANIDIYNQDGKKVSEREAPKGLSDGVVRKALLWEAVKMQQAKRRKGNASTKTRGEVTGSTRKIYRQKGTGNARHGDIKAPLFVGGGRVFGPRPRDYSYRLPRTSRRNALKSALTMKLKEGKIKLLQNLNVTEIKTKKMAQLFKNWQAPEALLVIEAKNPAIEKSVRNLPHHKVLRVEGINVYDVLKFDQILVTEEAFKKIEEILQ